MERDGRALAAPRRPEWFAVAAILLGALLLRLPGLGHPIFGMDEQFTAEEALRLAELYDWAFWRIPTEGLHPVAAVMPVAYYLAALGMKLFGPAFESLRVPFLLTGLATLVCTWHVGRRITGSATVGLLAAGLLTINPSHVEYSTLARCYMPGMLLGLIWVDRLLELLERPTRSAATWVAVATTVGCLTYLPFPMFAVAGAGYGLLLLRRASGAEHVRLRRACILLGGAVLVGGLLGWFQPLRLVLASGVAEGHDGVSRVASFRSFAGRGALRVGLPMLALAAFGGWSVLRRRRARDELLLIVTVVVALGIAAGGLFERIRGRHVLIVLPFVYLLAVLGLRAIARETGRRGVAICIGALSVALLGISTAAHVRFAGERGAACAMLDETLHRMRPRGPVVFVGDAEYDDPLRLMGWRPGEAVHVHPTEVAEIRDRLAADPATLLVVVDAFEYWIDLAGLDIPRELRVVYRVDIPHADHEGYITVYRRAD